MPVPMYVKIAIIALNASAFAVVIWNSDPTTKTGRGFRYVSLCMVFLDILVALRHLHMLDFH